MGKIWINRGKRSEHSGQGEDTEQDKSPQAAPGPLPVLPRDVSESLLPLKENHCELFNTVAGPDITACNRGGLYTMAISKY